MGSFSWSNSRRTMGRGGFPSRRLGPYFSSRFAASAAVNPRWRSVPSSFSVSPRLLLCHALIGFRPFFEVSL